MNDTMISYPPIVLFAYNRPDHLKQTVDRLSHCYGAADSEVWIFCDGLKANHAEEAFKEVRAFVGDLEKRHSFKNVRAFYSNLNMGLAASIRAGVSRVIEEYDRVIVLEDDLLVSRDFLQYMANSLTFFEQYSYIASITGFCPLEKRLSDYTHDFYMIPRNCSHGWATWRDRWRSIEWGPEVSDLVWNDPELRRRLLLAGPDQQMRHLRHRQGKINSWSILVDLWIAKNGLSVIYPTENRVRNIGFDGSGVHCRSGDAINSSFVGDQSPYSLSLPEKDARVLKAFRTAYGGGPLKQQAREFRDWFLKARHDLATFGSAR